MTGDGLQRVQLRDAQTVALFPASEFVADWNQNIMNAYAE